MRGEVEKRRSGEEVGLEDEEEDKEDTNYGKIFKVNYSMQLVPSEASFNLVIDS